ncbi:hypothetical protein MNBD_GAMMA12-2717 [hydrothermal vent metagenome]|uniref:N-acetyltransferase domain-containing protein n=1 Tax=hydrothermal vent metagenome TaxID=652676 RepID=A0A3B0Y3J8_9ZZZZ
MHFPVLKTDNIVLDEITQDDEQWIFDIFSNDEVTQYYDLESFKTLDQAKGLIELVQARFRASCGIRWAIRLVGSETCIGTCGFNSWNKNYQSTVIGYDLNQNYWNRGIMTESLQSIIAFAFKGGLACKDVNRIQADIVPENAASEKVLTKLGFEVEGLLRESAYWKDRFQDLKCFSLLRSDYIINGDNKC